jgi:hypothetical protein
LADTVNIMLGNLPPHLWETNADSVRFVKHALEANGVRVTLGTEHLDRTAVNLFFDRFYVEPDFPMKMKTAGVKYGLICTEALSPDGVWNYGAEGVAPDTVLAFELAAQNAEFVWCQLDESVAACSALNPNSAHLPYGYLAAMEEITPLPRASKDIDLLMSGMPSPRRESLRQDLADAGMNTYYPGQPVPVYIRDALMARSRMSLSLQKTDRHRIVSVTRICHSVINKVPVVLEVSDTDNPYADYCLTVTPEDLVLTCRQNLAETDLEQWAADRYEQLKSQKPMDKMMGALLEQTFNP